MKKFVTGLVVLLAACLGVSHIASSQDQKARKEKKEILLDESTLSQKQKHHRQYLKTSPGPKLRDLASKGFGDIIVTVEDPLTISTSGKSSTAIPTLPFTVCNVGTIVVGTLTTDSPQLTEDESFLFTEYTLNVEEVIKSEAAHKLKAGETITVIREGGVGQINGRTVRAEREGFKPFTLGGRYVLFLRDVPETGAYLAYPYGSFALYDNAVLPFGKMPEGVPLTRAPFLDAIRNTTATAKCVTQQ
jgi:hypothetical protein